MMRGLGSAVGPVAFVVGAVLAILAFMDARGVGAMLPGTVLAAVGFTMFLGLLAWGFSSRRTEEQ